MGMGIGPFAEWLKGSKLRLAAALMTLLPISLCGLIVAGETGLFPSRHGPAPVLFAAKVPCRPHPHIHSQIAEASAAAAIEHELKYANVNYDPKGPDLFLGLSEDDEMVWVTGFSPDYPERQAAARDGVEAPARIRIEVTSWEEAPSPKVLEAGRELHRSIKAICGSRGRP